jgi:hypothetical protein
VRVVRPSPHPAPAGTPTAPGTRPERPGRARDEPLLWVGLLVVTALVLGAAAATGVDHGCRSSPPPLSGPPSPGTARADYCSVLEGPLRWLVLVVAPWVAVAVTTVALRRRAPVVPVVLAALACAGAGINWLIFDGLAWAPSA